MSPGDTALLNVGVLGDIPAGTTLTFGFPTENTNFLQTPARSLYLRLRVQSVEADRADAARPSDLRCRRSRRPRDIRDRSEHPCLLPVRRRNSNDPGYTGYVTGGWTGIGAGYPGAIGYMSPTSQGSVYIAPNMTFDFTEIQYQGKTVAQALADWAAQFNDHRGQFGWHAHRRLADPRLRRRGVGYPGSTTLALHHADVHRLHRDGLLAGYEFVTLEDLASRIAAQQKAHIDYTTIGNTITATVTPDPTAPDVGEMALNVVNGATKVIQNVTNWYAYNSKSCSCRGTAARSRSISAPRRTMSRTSPPCRCGETCCRSPATVEPELLHGGRG